MASKFEKLVRAEIAGARERHEPIHSLHEGYSVILEELQELWEEVMRKRSLRDHDNIRLELVQIAAVATRVCEDLGFIDYRGAAGRQRRMVGLGHQRTVGSDMNETLITISGPMACGKTRIMREIVAHLSSLGLLVDCQDGGSWAPYVSPTPGGWEPRVVHVAVKSCD